MTRYVFKMPDLGEGTVEAALPTGWASLDTLEGDLLERAVTGTARAEWAGVADARLTVTLSVAHGTLVLNTAGVDVVAGAGTHLLPGLSYTYPGVPPTQYGLSPDADSLQPITLVQPEDFDAARYLPEAIADSIFAIIAEETVSVNGTQILLG